MTRDKVVFVSRKWPPAVGGMETYAHRLSGALAPSVALERIVLPGKANGAPPGVLALVGFGIRAFASLLVRHHDASIVHITDMASWPLALAARFGKAGIVVSAHGTDVTYPRRGTWTGRMYATYLRLGARLLRRAVVVANSQATAAEARQYGFDDVRVVPLATDFTRRSAGPDLDRLLFSGRILPLKGLGWFVQSVLDRLPSRITLDVAGTIWDSDEARVLEHARVTYLGHLDQHALAEAFAAHLAVVVPNIEVASGQFEGFGLVAIEAAAAGGVVLASDHGGLTEAVIDGETGMTLRSGDAEAWVRAIEEVRGWSSTDRRDFTDRASAAAARVFSWDRVARETLDAYRAAQKGLAT